jgi:peptidoglycan/xylan/chitin deacetylase (PgdA/CDA1 family)
MNKIYCVIALALFSSCVILRPTNFPESEKIVLFTFDDGPNNDHDVTSRLLDVLRKHNVKAVFNVIGRNVNKYPTLVKRAYTEGHIVANHGNTEWPLLLRGYGAVRHELDSCDAAIGGAIGDTAFHARYFRPSFGWYGPAVLHFVKIQHRIIVGTTWYGLDDQKPPVKAPEVLKDLLATVRHHQGGVITLHDGKAEYTHLDHRLKQGWKNYDRSLVVTTTDSAITQLEREGYAFPRLDEEPKNDLTDRQKALLGNILYK